jgi:hypothetical protein
MHGLRLPLAATLSACFFHAALDFRFAGAKPDQPSFQFADFLFDLVKFGLVLLAHQAVCPKFLVDILFKQASEDLNVGTSPDYSLPVFELAGVNALDDKGFVYPVFLLFLLRRYVAQGRPFAIPLAVFCHFFVSSRS